MTNQYLTSLRSALFCAAILALVFVPLTSTLAQTSFDANDKITRSQVFARTNYEWPFATGPHYGNVIADAPGTIRASVGSFHLSQGELPFPAELQTPNRLAEIGAQHFLVQTYPELAEDLQSVIVAQGGEIAEYRAGGTLVVRLNQNGFQAIENAPGVAGIVPYHAAFKLHPSIGRVPLPDPIQATSSVYQLKILVWESQTAKAVAQHMATLGVDVTGIQGDTILVEAHRSMLAPLAQMEQVRMIFEDLPVVLHGEETTTTMQTGMYNGGAIPYSAEGLRGDGAGLKTCDDFGADPAPAYSPCVVEADCDAYVDDLSSTSLCTDDAVQVLMILDSGIQLDAGDLSNERGDAGTPGDTHRKVLVYESTNSFGNGIGDSLGCDSPQQGGSTHGHVVATTALGNGTDVDSSYGLPWFASDTQGDPWKLDGVAMRAKLVAYDGQVTPPTVSCGDPLKNTIVPGDLWNPDTPTESSLGKSYINERARIFNMSWGAQANTYDDHPKDIDEFIIANRDAMVFVSAGNEGTDSTPADGIPDEGTIASLATTKNGLVIGASRNANLSGLAPEGRAFFSASGPAVDKATVNRISPQLMAPGDEFAGGTFGLSSEFACRSSDNDQDDPVECDIVQGVEGTSFSSPAAAGAALVVRDYFSQGFYPDKSKNEDNRVSSISGALVKAVLVSSANFLDGANVTVDYRWNNEQGYGRIELDHALPLENWPASPSGLIVDDAYSDIAVGLSLAESLNKSTVTTSNFTVCNDTEPLSIALAWTDSFNVEGTLVNDLNLQVTSPSGKKYRGNYFTDDGNRDGVIITTGFTAEDCPPIGSKINDKLINASPWSLPVCGNTQISTIGTNTATFDRTHNVEAIFLHPDPDGAHLATNYIPNYYTGDPTVPDEDWGCHVDSTNPGGVDGFGLCGNDQDCSVTPLVPSPEDDCVNGKRQPEIGEWEIRVNRTTAGIDELQDFAVAIAGGVCLGSSVRFTEGGYSCNESAVVQVSERPDDDDPVCLDFDDCDAADIAARTTLRVFNSNNDEVDCEGPGCLPTPTASLTFTGRDNTLIFTSTAVNLTDGTVQTRGNGTLDVRNGDTIEVIYNDVGAGAVVTPRRSTAAVLCQVAMGFGSQQFAQWGQDSAILINGGCERAPKRNDRCLNIDPDTGIGTCEKTLGTCEADPDCPKFSKGYFEYGYPDRYMDADELINMNVAFNSEETIDLNNVLASLRCVSVDADSPADCKPSGAGCDPTACGEGGCDPRRENNTTCPYMDILNSPQFLGLVPSGSAMGANFSIQMKDDGVFDGTSPTVEMLLEVTADTSGRTTSGVAVTRQRLNVDTQRKLYNTDFPTGGASVEVLDMNNNEREDNPITDLAGYQAMDFRFETKSYSDMTVGLDESGGTVPRNGNLLSPWNFDGDNGGFVNGLNSTSDESQLNIHAIHNWGEDKNFNGIEDGQCLANPALGCWVFPNDARCPGTGNCDSIEDNADDDNFTQNHNQRGGCGWQTKSLYTCTDITTRGCDDDTDCEGTCQLTENQLLSTFDPCTADNCDPISMCIDVTPVPAANYLLPCSGPGDTGDVECGCTAGQNCCQDFTPSCENDAGTCDTDAAATTGGAWHTGPILDRGDGTTCAAADNDECVWFRMIPTNEGLLSWWELLLTPVMEKVDQSVALDGLPTSQVNIAMWGWNMSMDLPDDRAQYTWEFDTDTETLFPVDLVADATVLNGGSGGYGPVTNESNPQLTNGYNLFAPMGQCSDIKCSDDDLPCILTSDCQEDHCRRICQVTLRDCGSNANCDFDEDPNDFCQGNCTVGGQICTEHPECTIEQTCPAGNTQTGACATNSDCTPGRCDTAGQELCYSDAPCNKIEAGKACIDSKNCVRTALSYNGTSTAQSGDGVPANNRQGQNSCYFESGRIVDEAFDLIGPFSPPDDDLDNDGDGYVDEFVTANGPLRTHDIVAFNGPDMRLNTLEDLFGDTGNTFQAALGFQNLEGREGSSATRGFGLAIDDMFVEWFEFTQDVDATDCAVGQCAELDVPSGRVYEGVTSLPISLQDSSPYGSYCTTGTRAGKVCYSANVDADCDGIAGACVAGFNDCDLDGFFNGSKDTDDCNENGIKDVVVLASSEKDLGEIIVLDQVSPTSSEYRGNVTVSVLSDSDGVLYLVQVGVDPPTITLTYDDYDDGTGQRCENNVVDANQGRVQTFAVVGIQFCDVSLVSTAFVDNGDGDLFLDSQETIELDFSLQNNCGLDLNNCVARLSTNSPEVDCIIVGVVPLGLVPGASSGPGPIFSSPNPFIFKMDDDLSDRSFLGITTNDPLAADFNVAVSCTEIDGLTFPQDFSMTLDLNINDDAQDPTTWTETFESGTAGLAGTDFVALNIDAGLPGADPDAGLVISDGWRCQYSDPDWINSTSYNVFAASSECYPGLDLNQANDVWWDIDSPDSGGPDGGRAYRGTRSMYYGIYLESADENFTTPLNVVEAVGTSGFVNLGVTSPKLSFWHQISLGDSRTYNTAPFQSTDRAVAQIKLYDGATAITEWMNLEPIQNSYDQQAYSNYFNCMFDPTDDGNTEDDFFDPTDPDRRLGPSSTCFPTFSWAWMGSTTEAFSTNNLGNATTPPDSTDAPELGLGTWVESVIDLSNVRGRRVQLRFLVSALNTTGLNHNALWGDGLDERDDGWWIDNVHFDEVLSNAAEFKNDDYIMGQCTGTGAACISQCKFNEGTDCLVDGDCVAAGDSCLLPCVTGDCQKGPEELPEWPDVSPNPPDCGLGCTVVTPNAWVTPVEALNPATVVTPVPGQSVTINGAEPPGGGAAPSVADACLTGNLQFLFCRDGDPLGDGPNPPNTSCDDPEDLILRSWTENAVITVAPQAPASYTMEVRCSSDVDCKDERKIDISVTCPGTGTQNALGLKAVRWIDKTTLQWSGAGIDVDVWQTDPYTSAVSLADYSGSEIVSTGAVTSLDLSALAPDPDEVIGILVKAEGPYNTNAEGYFCNSVSYRSGGSAEIEHKVAPDPKQGRDAWIPNP